MSPEDPLVLDLVNVLHDRLEEADFKIKTDLDDETAD